MKAVYLVKNGKASSAFEIRDFVLPEPGPLEVQIAVRAFGLNFADVMARLGLYPDAPTKPGILGYDVVGHIVKVGTSVPRDITIGSNVVALTRFGGYAQCVNTDYRGVVPIDEKIPADIATSLATQGGTAYYMAKEMVNIHQGDQVLVHAGAGGVGSILCQLALASGAIVYSTASSDAKLDYLRSIGVHHPINYKATDFLREITKLLPEGVHLDIVFDAIGGSNAGQGYKLLGPGGRMVYYGASALTNARFIWSKIGIAWGFGLYSPISLLNTSKSLIGVNMLRIADHKPSLLGSVIRGIIDLYHQQQVHPLAGGVYHITDLAEAHNALENRTTMGKMAITWD